jgi:hypothetical protein
VSILSVLPGPEWFEPADYIEVDDDDTPICPPDVLTATAYGGWWTAAGPDLDTDAE